ncbi:hypothetical protein [Coleofasciculus sp. E2-BRE-01]|uniref:hypothetical protein n=1 Tax=Coleofasciculus sp. E2-BRE-01 TaxID=3069524 RepID=UPI0032FD372B
MIQSKQKLRKILSLTEYLAQAPDSAGIIDNATNDVLFRNPASKTLFRQWKRQFKVEVLKNTSTTHDTQITIAQVTKLKEFSLPLHLCDDFRERRYTLHFGKVGEILAVDRFYLLKYGGRNGCRVWVNQFWSYACLL